jgi:flagellin-like hook-associated protein FlgL
VTAPKQAPTDAAADAWALGVAWLHDASAALRRAADEVAAGDVDRALERLDAAITTAESARTELGKQGRRHTVAGVIAEVLREHLQQEQEWR